MKVSSSIRWLSLLLFIYGLFTGSVYAQGWNLDLNINPYPSPYISDWETNPTAVGQATVINNTNQRQEIRLFVQLFKSDEGLLVEAESPVKVVDELTTRILNNTEFMGFSEAEYRNDRVRNLVYRTGRLPQGLYTVCTVIRDMFDRDLSMQVCRDFEIVYPEPPQLIYPDHEQVVMTEFPTFQWIPITVPADFEVTYRLRIVEVLEGQTPLRALEANVPLLEEAGISSPSFTYPLDAIAFEEGARYAWQVQALDQFGLPPTSNQGQSEIFTFVYRPEESDEEEEEESEEIADREVSEEPCGGECMAEVPVGTPSGGSFSPGDELQMGHFVLTLTDVSGTGANLSGTGEVQVPFLNDVRVNVTFENLEVNDEGVVLNGRAEATDDIPDITWSDVETTVDGAPVSIPNPTDEQAEAFHDIFEGGERVVNTLTGGRAMGMPLGFRSEDTGGVGYTVGITRMVFEPQQASLNAMLTFDIPSLGDKLIALGSNDICFTPGGLGEQGTLYLARDWEIVQSGGNRMVLAGIGDSSDDLSTATYAEWGCDGFECIQVNGFVEFPEDKLIKETDTGDIASGPVQGRFSFEACDGRNFLAQIDMDPFRISGMSGWGFKVEDAWLDFSDTENPPDFALPDNYEAPGLDDPRLAATWSGFYLKLAQLHAPGGFEDRSVEGTDGRARVAVHDLIIDGTGVTASIRAENLIDYDDGNVKGWAFSLDTIELNILQNGFESGGFNGGLGLPISSDRLNYSSNLSLSEDDDIQYDFVIEVGEEGYGVEAWRASLNLDSGSNITFEFNEGADEPVTLSALLHGNLGIEADRLESIPGLSFEGIPFQNLYIGTESPYFNVGEAGVDGNVFGLASPQKKMVTTYVEGEGSTGGFPVTVDNIGLTGGPTRPGLQFTTRITLVDQVGFAADFTLSIFGELTIPVDSGDRFSFGYDGIEPDEIILETDFKGFSLDGILDFYDERDRGGGKGVRGVLHVGLPVGFDVDLQADFGRTSPSHEEGEFSYWYINGLVTFSSGIDIFSGFAMYGFGGGVYHHLSSIDSSLPDKSGIPLDVSEGGDGSSTTEPLESASLTEYNPTKDVFLGFKITAVMGVKGEPKSFNMDVTLEIAIGSSGEGLQYLTVEGNGYVMRDLEETEGTGNVWANLTLTLDMQNKIFEGDLSIYVKVDNDLFYLRGPPDRDYLFTQAKFYADNTGTWYLHMPPTRGGRIQRNTLEAGVDAKLFELGLDFRTYLLVGHEIPAGLPPLPPEVADILGTDRSTGKPGNEATNVASDSDRDRAQLQRSNKMDDFVEGKGFATGVQVNFDTRLEFAIFYAEFWFTMGFDVSFLKINMPCAENPGGGPPGINGFYAQGQVYAGIGGAVGIHIDLFFIDRDIEFIELGAAFALQGKFPNPAWFQGRIGLRYSVLGGLISGTTRFKVEFGQECTLTRHTSPFGDMEFVEEVEPDGEDVSVYTDPVAYFNLPVNQLIEVPTDDSGDDVHTYEAFIESFTLTNTDSGEEIPNPTIIPSSDRYSARLYTPDFLEGTSNYNAEITVSAWEHFPDKPKEEAIVINESGIPVVWEETKDTDFVTEPEPNKIEDVNVLFTYPIERQNYFLKGETTDNQGVIRLAKGAENLFDGYIDINQDGYEDPLTEHVGEYIARFTQVESREETEVELDYRSGNSLWIQLPDLENGKHYSVQVIARMQPDFSMYGDAFTSMELAGSLFEKGYSKNQVENYFEESDLDFNQLETDVMQGRFQDVVREDFAQTTVDSMGTETSNYASTINIDMTTVLEGVEFVVPETLPGGEHVRENEHLLYDYYFRTSKYNTLQEKMGGVDPDATYYPESGEFLFYYLFTEEGFNIDMELDEPFDEFDLFGVTREVVDVSMTGGSDDTPLEMKQTLEPLVQIRTDRSNPFFEAKADKLYNLFDQLKLLKDRNYGFETGGDGDSYYYQTRWPLKCMPLIGTYERSDYHYGNTVDRQEAIFSITIEDDSDIPDPLPTWALENAAGINNTPAVTGSTGSDSGSTGTGGDLTLSPEGTIEGGTLTSNPFLSGFMNGSFNSVSFSGIEDHHINLIGQSGSSSQMYDLHLFYDVANAVHEDADDMKINLAWIFGGHGVDGFGFIHSELRYRGDSELANEATWLGMYQHCGWSDLEREFIEYFMQKYERCDDSWRCDPEEDLFITPYKQAIRGENYEAYQDAYELLDDRWDFSLPRGNYNLMFDYVFPERGEFESTSFRTSTVNKSFEY